ncbi:MAG: hypothetical protein ABI383_16460 [Acidobacteriaceae bacterium]
MVNQEVKATPEKRRAFKTEDVVPESGSYRVNHAPHRLPREIVLLKGQRFPRCAKCTTAVSFEADALMPNLERRGRVLLYELPELPADTLPQSLYLSLPLMSAWRSGWKSP